MKAFLIALLESLPYIRRLRMDIRKQGAYPAGHYYSPIPSKEDILAFRQASLPQALDIPSVDLNREFQGNLLAEYVQYYGEMRFPEGKTPGRRYHFDNTWFCYSDAIFLYSFLRKNNPRRIVEVGSGYSSAVMLDTADDFLAQTPDMVFIEPYPERLFEILTDRDKKKINLMQRRVQNVPLDVFSSLEPGDLLFIDSSHVVKCGSDLHFLFFEVLPILKSGVFVHFHDVFFPFDYPQDWLDKGRYWNENYFLRAFMSYNTAWEIYFFNTFVHLAFGSTISESMPLCAKNKGGSLYLRRR